MNSPTVTIESNCSHADRLAAYIDGELLPREEIELETHLASCQSCNRELNEQKKLLCVLDYALESEREIELPVNFTRVVVANAESKVSGLRRPQERAKALFVCAALFLLVLLGLGGETETTFNAFAKFTEQVYAVGGFVVRLVYDLSVGMAVILRSLSYQLIYKSSVSAAFFIGFAFLILIAVSRFIIRSNKI